MSFADKNKRPPHEAAAYFFAVAQRRKQTPANRDALQLPEYDLCSRQNGLETASSLDDPVRTLRATDRDDERRAGGDRAAGIQELDAGARRPGGEVNRNRARARRQCAAHFKGI